MNFNDDHLDEFGVEAIVSICMSWIADGITRDEYLQQVPLTLLDEGGFLFDQAPPADRLKIAILLSRQIWSGCPIPARGYHLDPLPNQKRNDRCACGSGLKFKQCCRNLPPLPFDKLPMWPLLLLELSDKQKKDAIASNQIPLELLGEIGLDWIENGKPAQTVKLLEPLFAPGQKPNWRLGFALNVLCDAYDQLGHTHKKAKFLQRIAHGKTEVSGDAWQRLTTMFIDRDDLQGAADAFQQAMRSHPDDPSLGPLEVLLMVRQGRDQEHIRQRIRFWKQKLDRSDPDDEAILALLDEAEEDPQRAFRTSIENALDPAFINLQHWISNVLGPRQVPLYGFQPVDLPQEDELEDEREEGQGHLQKAQPGMLEPPAEVQQLERQWLEVFPDCKPFSTQPYYLPEVWEQTDWLTFLQQHPQAADSLSILDDLVAILEGFPQIEWMGVAAGVFEPIHDRARDILLKVIDNQKEAITLPWLFMENRPGLRVLYQRAMQSDEMDPAAEKDKFEEYIKINPGDNHGVRSLLVNYYLRDNEDQKALELASAYPRDMMVDIKFGQILARYRQFQLKEAEALLRKAHYERPLIARYLWRKRVKQPTVDHHSVIVGGEDEAWLYREDMRDVWESTPGALDWVRKNTK